MYRLYGQRIEGGYDRIAVRNTLEEIEVDIQEIDAKEYRSYMLIENKGQGDNLLRTDRIYDECEVEYVDNLKTNIEVKATTFTPSRMKRKEEIMRETRDYIDR